MDAKVTLPALLAEVDRARAFLRETVAGVAFSEEDLFRLELTVTEICINIVRYAYPDCPGKMSLRIWDEGAVLFVEFVDNGRAFDTRSAPAPTLEALMRGERKGGLGIYLARRLSDSFDYRREDGRNIVKISKKMPAP